MRSARPYFIPLVALVVGLTPTATSLHAQSHPPDYDDVDPWVGVTPAERGPDSSAVARFLTSLSTIDPVVCQFAVQSSLPILGICRGIQLINVALGGTLFQDLLFSRPSTVTRLRLRSTSALKPSVSP